MELKDRAWAEATLVHQTRKVPLDRRKIQNNTWLERRPNGDIAVRFHETDVVTYHSDGMVTLDTGGWYSVTTRERIETYALPFSIQSLNARWMLHTPNPEYVSDWHEIRPDTDLVIFTGDNLTLWKVDGLAHNVRFTDWKEAAEARRIQFGEAPPYWSEIGPFYDGIKVDLTKPFAYPMSAEAEGLHAQDTATMKALNRYLKKLDIEDYEDCRNCSVDGVDDPQHLASHLTEGTLSRQIVYKAVSEAGYKPEFVGPHKRFLRRYFKSRLLVGAYGGRRPNAAVAGVGYEYFGTGGNK